MDRESISKYLETLNKKLVEEPEYKEGTRFALTVGGRGLKMVGKNCKNFVAFAQAYAKAN